MYRLSVASFLLFLLFLWMFPALLHAQSTTVTVGVQAVHQLPEDTGTAKITLKYLDGPLQGETFPYQIHLWGHKHYDPEFKVGKEFTGEIRLNDRGGIERFILHQERKDWKLLILFLLVMVVLFAVGRWEGLIGLISTLLTLGMVYLFFFPWIGVPGMIFPTGILICLATIVITVGFVMKWDQPSLPTIGALLVVFAIIFAATITGLEYLNLDGTRARHTRLIITWLDDPGQLWKLITVGIVLGTLGALMDVAVVISSTINEIVRDAPDITWLEAYNSGIRVGREILSTMVNTLVFAYMGILLPILLAFRIFELSWLQFLHYDFVGIELLRISIGLFGLSLIIPITASLSAWWCCR